jgi:hypothetical protein
MRFGPFIIFLYSFYSAYCKRCCTVRQDIKIQERLKIFPTLQTHSFTHSLTHSLMELTPSWEAANCAVTQEIPSILWNSEVHYRVHKSPPRVPILSQISPIYTIPSYLSKIRFISIFFRLGRLSKESVQVRGSLNIFVTSLFFTVRSC